MKSAQSQQSGGRRILSLKPAWVLSLSTASKHKNKPIRKTNWKCSITVKGWCFLSHDKYFKGSLAFYQQCSTVYGFFFVCLSEMRSHVAHAGPWLLIFLPVLLINWDCRLVPPFPGDRSLSSPLGIKVKTLGTFYVQTFLLTKGQHSGAICRGLPFPGVWRAIDTVILDFRAHFQCLRSKHRVYQDNKMLETKSGVGVGVTEGRAY